MNWNEYIPELPRLAKGAHDEGEGSLCAMEMVAYLERLPHSDRPQCTCPVLAAYTRKLNDWMSNEERQLLLPILPSLVGTVSLEHETDRAKILVMGTINKILPLALGSRFDVSALVSARTLAEGRTACLELRKKAHAASYASAAASAASHASHASHAAFYASAAASDASHASHAAFYASAAASDADAAASDSYDADATYAYADAANRPGIVALRIELLTQAIGVFPAKPVDWLPSRVDELINEYAV